MAWPLITLSFFVEKIVLYTILPAGRIFGFSGRVAAPRATAHAPWIHRAATMIFTGAAR
jgi:hypothetical protein